MYPVVQPYKVACRTTYLNFKDDTIHLNQGGDNE